MLSNHVKVLDLGTLGAGRSQKDAYDQKKCIIIIIIIISFMEFGHMLTRSGLTYPEVSSKA